MNKKTYNLVVGVLGGLSAIANTAAVEICNLFVSEKVEELERA